MALPLPPGLTPAEVAFLCEMEQITIVPRQRMEALELMGGSTQPLIPPFPATLPLWLAILLKRQRRANIRPPPWMDPAWLTSILDIETREETAQVFAPAPELQTATTEADEDAEYLARDTIELSAPFLQSSTARAQPDALPYHWVELSHLLLTHAPDDFQEPETVRRLIRDLKEVRMSKLRRGYKVLGSGAGLQMNGVGAMEIAEVRGFVTGVIDNLRKINHAREEGRLEREREQGGGFANSRYRRDEDDEEDEMQL